MDIEHRVVATLKSSRDRFQFYGDNHLAKDPPQLEKARVNYDAVAEINETLMALGESVRNPDVLELPPEAELPAGVAELLKHWEESPGYTLAQHFEKMQEQMRRYLEPMVYIALDGQEHETGSEAEKDAFIDDIIHMLDGPEQRLAEANLTERERLAIARQQRERIDAQGGG